ncbi:MAG: Uma2 family endonuclease [Gloeomargarita sp. SKYG116]|nr:Uma2 family endonuclease [Gloeomargarita sp. SKYG116]MDW8402237.1 Uma2 family endonuclease [Gloeomargarita sp. SKYGB_i_bin116]
MTIDGSAMAIKPIICLDQRNEVQPDAVLFIPSRQATIGSEDFIEGAPELIVEIAASIAAIDLHKKSKSMLANQFRSIWFGEPSINKLTSSFWFLVIINSTNLKSKVFPGLWLDFSALLQGNLSQVLSVLQRALGSAEYQDFVRSL